MNPTIQTGTQMVARYCYVSQFYLRSFSRTFPDGTPPLSPGNNEIEAALSRRVRPGKAGQPKAKVKPRTETPSPTPIF